MWKHRATPGPWVSVSEHMKKADIVLAIASPALFEALAEYIEDDEKSMRLHFSQKHIADTTCLCNFCCRHRKAIAALEAAGGESDV